MVPRMTPSETPPFALTLRAHMAGSRWTVRSLGRALDPDEPERGRRKVQRILSGTVRTPTRETRDALADLLGVAREVFAVPTDEPADEDAPISRDEWRVYRSVQRRIERLASVAA